MTPVSGARGRVVEVAVMSELSLRAARKVVAIWGGKGWLSPAALQPVAKRVAAEQPFERPFMVLLKPPLPQGSGAL